MVQATGPRTTHCVAAPPHPQPEQPGAEGFSRCQTLAWPGNAFNAPGNISPRAYNQIGMHKPIQGQGWRTCGVPPTDPLPGACSADDPCPGAPSPCALLGLALPPSASISARSFFPPACPLPSPFTVVLLSMLRVPRAVSRVGLVAAALMSARESRGPRGMEGTSSATRRSSTA